MAHVMPLPLLLLLLLLLLLPPPISIIFFFFVFFFLFPLFPLGCDNVRDGALLPAGEVLDEHFPWIADPA
jgi:hypothetical protein